MRRPSIEKERLVHSRSRGTIDIHAFFEELRKHNKDLDCGLGPIAEIWAPRVRSGGANAQSILSDGIVMLSKSGKIAGDTVDYMTDDATYVIVFRHESAHRKKLIRVHILSLHDLRVDEFVRDLKFLGASRRAIRLLNKG